MAALQEDLGPAIDPDTACVACGSDKQPESMLICDSCQQGFHSSCFGLSVRSSGSVKAAQLCSSCSQVAVSGLRARKFSTVTAQTLIMTESLKFYSTLKQLVRPPKTSLELAQQLYELRGVELSSVVLSSRRHNMFGPPAAAAGLATEAWCLLPDDAADTAQQALAQPAKQVYLLERSKSHKAALPPALVEPALATQMQPMGSAVAQMQPMQVAATQMQQMGFAAAQMQPMQVAAAQMQPMQVAARLKPPMWYKEISLGLPSSSSPLKCQPSNTQHHRLI